MTLQGKAARFQLGKDGVEITLSVTIDGEDHYVVCPVGDGLYMAQRALEVAAEFARSVDGRRLATAVLRNEHHDGGLLSKETVKLAEAVESRG